jgi:hypothetical protein
MGIFTQKSFLINFRKFFLRDNMDNFWASQECATIYLFNRLINVYQEYICGVAAKEYYNFVLKIDKVFLKIFYFFTFLKICLRLKIWMNWLKFN